MRRCRFSHGLLLAAVLSLVPSLASAQTGTWLDRTNTQDVRLMNYNVNWNSIFPSEDPTNAARFDRLVSALQPDILALQEINYYYNDDVIDRLNTIAPLPGGASWYAFTGYDCVIASKYPLSMTRYQVPDAPTNYSLGMALVDLPDETFQEDLYLMNNHYRCCSGNDPERQEQSDILVSWMRDAMTPGGDIDLPENTAMAVVGDLNIVEGFQPVTTLITGDIQDNSTFGPDIAPDWDGTNNTDLHPLHNSTSSDDYTWRDDSSSYDPGRLDYIVYTDSVMDVQKRYVLNTTTMTQADLNAANLYASDVQLDPPYRYDHLPMVMDFREYAVDPGPGDCDGDGDVDADDLAALGMNWSPVADGKTWSDGDFDGDGDTDADDLAVLGMNWNPAGTIPEPASLFVLSAGLFWVRRR